MTAEELLQVIKQAAQDGLEDLNLGDQGLQFLPPEIGELKALRSLQLYQNQLSCLPAEIGQLTHLQMLSLRNNQLSRLLAEIGQLIESKNFHEAIVL